MCVSSGYKPDPHAFLFTLTNASGLPAAKAKATIKPGQAVLHYSGSLPTFGDGDLLIGPNAHTEAVSWTKWGHTYPLPPGAADRMFLSGGGNVRHGADWFKLVAVEVFLVE